MLIVWKWKQTAQAVTETGVVFNVELSSHEQINNISSNRRMKQLMDWLSNPHWTQNTGKKRNKKCQKHNMSPPASPNHSTQTRKRTRSSNAGFSVSLTASPLVVSYGGWSFHKEFVQSLFCFCFVFFMLIFLFVSDHFTRFVGFLFLLFCIVYAFIVLFQFIFLVVLSIFIVLVFFSFCVLFFSSGLFVWSG